MRFLAPFFMALVAVSSFASPQWPQLGGNVVKDTRQICAQFFHNDMAEMRAVFDECAEEIGMSPSFFLAVQELAERAEKQSPTVKEVNASRRRVMGKLAEAGHPRALVQAIQCFTSKRGYFIDGAIDTDRLRAVLLRKALGTPIEKEIRAALTSCPPVQGFNMVSYFACITQSCMKALQ